MKLASYKSTRPGLQGIANRLIRFRLRGVYSHNEVVFEPGDGVDHLMPDGSCEEVDGTLWCASSVAAERLPSWSRRRAGQVGGVRFKRIAFDLAKWDLVDCPADAVVAAARAHVHEGERYDWRLILGYVSWLILGHSSRWTCSEFCALLAGIGSGWRFDPCTLHAAVMAMGMTTRAAAR